MDFEQKMDVKKIKFLLSQAAGCDERIAHIERLMVRGGQMMAT